MSQRSRILRALKVIRTTNTAGLALLRVLLGAGLTAAGAWFVTDIETFSQVVPGQRFPLGAFVLAHAIVVAHLAGGIMIGLGFLTRVAAAVQLPILLGALVFGEAAATALHMPLPHAVFVAALAALVLVLGPGRISIDHVMRLPSEADAVPRPLPTNT